ncbi:hypothetical protein V6N13_021726 [Hibiscus sabdariffa]
MIAENKRRRQRKSLKQGNGDGNSDRINLGSRFEVLRDDLEVTDVVETSAVAVAKVDATTLVGGSDEMGSENVYIREMPKANTLGGKVVALKQGSVPQVSTRNLGNLDPGNGACSGEVYATFGMIYVVALCGVWGMVELPTFGWIRGLRISVI